MTNESVFLTAEEASTLQAAVGRIISSGIRLHASDVRIPAENGVSELERSGENGVGDGQSESSISDS